MKQILAIILFFSLSSLASAQNLNAGPDQTITAGQSVQLNGQASTSNIKWFTNGTGSFNNRNILNAIYYPSAEDISNGQVKLRLVNRKNPAIKDIMKVTILPSCPNISVDAGADVVQCGYGYGEVQLNATIDNNNNGMLWTSSGFGFFEDETSAITTYYYDQTDVDYAFIDLTATAFNDLGCPESSDYLSLNLQAAPYLEFPNPFVYATSENPVLYLSVYRYGYASSGTWTSSGSGTFDDANSDYPSYTASPQDILNGYLSFTYTTNDPIGPCGPTSGTMEGYIEFIPSCPTVSIYPSSDTICGSDFGGIYDLFANITGTDYYIQWTSDGQGFFFDETSASTAYEYTSGDAGFGGVDLTCNVYDASGYCSPVSSSFYLKLNDPARIDLNDFGYEACGDQPIFIDGNISGFANTVYWSTSGTGTFSPNPGSSTEYFPSVQDRMNGYISISGITNDPVGPCGASVDFTEIYFNGPYVDAGSDIVVCGYPYGGSIPLSAALGSNTYNTTWTTDGFGYFDDETNPNTNYNYDGTDVDYAFINLTITASGFGVCPDVSDVVTVNLQAAPSLAFPEPFLYACDFNPVFGVNVYRYGYASSGTWTSNGFGYFDSPSSDYTNYFASPEDVVNGTVALTYTSNDPDGPCIATSGDVLAIISNCGGGGDLIKNNSIIESVKSIQLFPNPTNGFIKIISELGIDYSDSFITDLTGKIIHCNWEGRNINVSMLQSGIYFLHVNSTTGIEVLKFIKQ